GALILPTSCRSRTLEDRVIGRVDRCHAGRGGADELRRHALRDETVRMMFARQDAIACSDLIGGGGAGQAEHGIRVALSRLPMRGTETREGLILQTEDLAYPAQERQFGLAYTTISRGDMKQAAQQFFEYRRPVA